MKRLLFGLFVLVMVGGACSSAATTDAQRNDEGEITENDEIGVFRLRTGDCLMLPDLSDEVESLDAVPCDEPHGAEVLGTSLVPGDNDSDFPGIDAVVAQAETDCLAQFQRVTGRDFMSDPDWDMTFLYPTEESWDRLNDREVVCIVAPLTGGNTTTLIDRA